MPTWYLLRIKGAVGRVLNERQTNRLKRAIGFYDNMTTRRFLHKNAAKPFYTVRYPKGLPILISGQIQRSGGTLFSQLFDGHPQVLAHPSEVVILKNIYLGSQSTFNKNIRLMEKLSKNGYSKANIDGRRHAFHFDARHFYQSYTNRKFSNKSQAVEYYFDHFFRYWLNCNNANLDAQKKKLITGFAPRMGGDHLDALLLDISRLYFVHLYRHPGSWWASSRLHNPMYEDISTIDVHWGTSQRKALATKQKYPGRTFIISFESLVIDTEKIMTGFCEIFELKYDPILVIPTFNMQPIGPDSSYAKNKTIFGVRTEALNRYKKILSSDENRHIEQKFGSLIQEMERACEHPFNGIRRPKSPV